MSVVETTDTLETCAASLPFLHPVRGELAGLDVLQDALHFSLGFCSDDTRASDVFAPLGSVRDRVVHVGDAAFVDQIHDQLHFMQALEVGHFRRITSLNQNFETGADQLNDAAAKNSLLTEQVGFAFFLEGGFDNARTTAANARSV